MKCQVSWNWGKSRTELVVTAQKRERLSLREAEWLCSEPSPMLIPPQFDYSRAQDKHVSVRYDIMGLTKLSKLLRRKAIDPACATRILERLDEAVRACIDASMQLDKMLFDPGFVYLDQEHDPHFVYVPFSGLQYDAQLNTPLIMLAAMSDPRRMNYQTAMGERQRDALHRFVQNSKVFSSNEFGKLLDGEFHQSDEADATSSVDSSFDALGVRVDSDDANLMFLSDLFSEPVMQKTTVEGFVVRRLGTEDTYSLCVGHSATMGSSMQCEFVVTGNKYMAAQHLTLTADEEGVTVVDHGTTYGTFAYDTRLRPFVPMRLNVGDCFLVGGEEFVVMGTGA